jgi:sialate O-acetylesterase
LFKQCVLFASLAWLAAAGQAQARADAGTGSASAPAHELILPLVFSDGAVLQRGKPIPVWGRGMPGAAVEVALGAVVVHSQVGAEGRWRVDLPAQAAGGPHELRIRVGGQERRIADVLVGEVWLASGQSNMEWPVSQSLHAAEDIASAQDDRLRHFKVPRAWADRPREQLEGGSWQPARRQTVGEFSAIGYTFARELRQVLQVPVGIIDSTWGGSAIEAWMDASMLGLDAQALEAKMAAQRAADDKVQAQVLQRLSAWSPVDPEAEDFVSPELDTGDWIALEVPASWESQGFAGMDGRAWYRTTFRLSARQAREGITLGLGRIDDSDVAWVNGQRVGGTTRAHKVPRVYPVPASALRAGSNVLAVRVQDDGGGGGIIGSREELYVQDASGRRRPLAGQWSFRPAQVRVSMLDGKNQADTLLYNAMVHPLQPYGLAGFIWYQGEANATEAGAFAYRDQFKALIQGWRAGWGSPSLPFLWAQLAPFHSGGDRLVNGGVVDSPWATLRESQSQALELPATAQVVITDVGDRHDIHPRDKRTVGQRLALAARHLAYGEHQAPRSGPVYRGLERDGARLYLTFDSADGLAVRGGRLDGFELAGQDGVFHRALARIEGERVVLHSVHVAEPVQARYGWSDDPSDANLVSGKGLPASPFRTTAW